MAGSLRAGSSRAVGRESATIACSALMAGSLRVGRPELILRVPLEILQCPHGGQSSCRIDAAHTAPLSPTPCSALMAGSLRAGLLVCLARALIVGSCSALMAGSLRAGHPGAGPGVCHDSLAVPSWRAVSVPDHRGHPDPALAQTLAVPSWRAVSVPEAREEALVEPVGVLQCPHGGQSPCRVPVLPRKAWPCALQCPHGGQSPCRDPPVGRVRVVLGPCSALMAGSLRAGGNTSTMPRVSLACSALMAGSLRAGSRRRRTVRR